MIITGSVKKITYYNQENGYSVVRVELSTEEMDRVISESGLDELYSSYITVVSMFTTLPFIDQTYTFTGDFEESKYGIQFRSTKTVKSVSQTEDGIITYLSSNTFKGIGKKTAKKIFDKLGENTIKEIIKDIRCLDGLGLKAELKENLYKTLTKEYKEDEDIVEIISLGLTMKMATKIIKVLGDKALHIVKENPYVLIDKVEGIGFIRADEIAMKVGIDKKSPYRIKALIMYTLEESIYEKGDTYIAYNDLFIECVKVANQKEEIITKDLFDDILKELKDFHKVIIDDDNNVYEVHLSYQENELSKMIYQLLSTPLEKEFSLDKINFVLNDIEKMHNIIYNDKQREAIIKALTEPVVVITGGPGTGKSTIIRGIIETYTALFPTEKQTFISDQIVLAAPTGRASKRLRELSFHKASTIHKLLGFTGHSFEVEVIDAQMVIIDEFSMVDVGLAYHLFKAIKPNTRVIIVGDADQLPAVGAGDILNDLILSREITTIKLNKIHRQENDSSIISLAHSIKDGKLPDDIYEPMKDRSFIKCDDESIISYTIRTIEKYLAQVYTREKIDFNKELVYKESYSNIPDKVYALINDVQVLVPMYRGALGIDAFNYYMQEEFNPLTDTHYKQIVVGNKKYREYDKVIQLVNRSEKEVMNGDIGYISKIVGEENNYEGLYVQYIFGEVYYEIDELDDISLAYAISIHKSQGSEFKLVIVPFTFKYYIMLKKKLIYTAITRAKRHLIMIGNFEALRKGILFVEEKRKTKLQEKLKTLIDKPNTIFDCESAFDEIKEDKEKEEEFENYLSPYDFMD